MVRAGPGWDEGPGWAGRQQVSVWRYTYYHAYRGGRSLSVYRHRRILEIGGRGEGLTFKQARRIVQEMTACYHSTHLHILGYR